MKDFKIGDTVFVQHNAYAGSVSGYEGSFIISKIHKGNGNLIVDGRQFYVSGVQAGDGIWKPKLVLDTPEQRKKIISFKRRRKLRYRLGRVNFSMSWSDEVIEAFEMAMDLLDKTEN